MQELIALKRENMKDLKKEKIELKKLIEEDNLPKQDSSDITGDTEPMDFMDPDG